MTASAILDTGASMTPVLGEASDVSRFLVKPTPLNAGILVIDAIPVAGNALSLGARRVVSKAFGVGAVDGVIPNLTARGTLSNLRPGDAVVLQRPARTLVQDPSGRFWLQNSTGQRFTPSGRYDFVTLPNGSIRVARPNTNPDFSTHLGLSGGGEVRFAGSVRFSNSNSSTRGSVLTWSNSSGHYRPPSSLSCNSGLPMTSYAPEF